MTRGGWRVEHQSGLAQELHDGSAALLAGPDPAPTVRILEVSRPAVVLGSTQAEADVDAAAAVSAGVEVARRPSGGAAVWLAPSVVLWVDVLIPASDRRWSDDVGRAAWPVGEAWAEAIRSVGVGPAAVWRGGLQRTAWSPKVCFAGVGAGEVVVGTGKAVGISQRRNRRAALLQTVTLLEWDPGPLLAVLTLNPEEAAAAPTELAAAGFGLGGDSAVPVRDAFLTAWMT